MARFGYLLDVNNDAELNQQRLAVRRAGPISELVVETPVHGTGSRPERDALIKRMVLEDILVVWDLASLGGTTRDVLLTVLHMHNLRLRLHSLQSDIDTSTPRGCERMVAFYELAHRERTLLHEQAWAPNGSIKRRPGRPRSHDDAKIDRAKELMRSGLGLRTVATWLGMPRSTLSDALKRLKGPRSSV